MIDINYIAGLFDGEGWVRIGREKFGLKTIRKGLAFQQGRGHIRYQIYAGINMTDPRSIRHIHEQFGGFFKTKRKPAKPTHRPLHQWITSSRKAYAFLVAIQPYLIIKKTEVDLAVEFQRHIWEHAKGSAHGGWMTPEEIQYRDSCHAEIARLKHVIYP
jgi:hypothetical protein